MTGIYKETLDQDYVTASLPGHLPSILFERFDDITAADNPR